jgi:ABC-type lipoprotein export system ATPase subunit
VFQAFHLIDVITVLDNIALSGRFAGMSKPDAGRKAKQILEKLKIEHLANKIPKNLSQGEKQRVAVARAIINQPDLIIADEPTASLESHQGLEIIKLLSDYAKKENKSVVVASHDRRICQYADKILYLQDGQLLETESMKTV